MVNRTAAQDGALQGMKEICRYMGKSENTVLKLIRQKEFPAQKIAGEWVSDIGLIADWRRSIIKLIKKTRENDK